MTTQREKLFPPSGAYVTDHRVYHREDERLLETVFRPAATDMGFLGLRRFGKSSFLMRIAAACAPGGKGEGYKAHFVNMQATPEVLNEKLQPIIDSLEDETLKTIVLLDDIQQVSTAEKPTNASRLAAKRLCENIGDIYRLARSSGGRVKVVICEPTNLEDWLEGRVNKRSIGEQLKAEIAPLRISAFQMLGKLGNREAGSILYGIPRGEERPEDYDEMFVASVNEAFGGNPWFLSLAASVLDENPHLFDKDRLANIIILVDERATEQNAIGRRSIYDSLSQSEQVIVKMLSAKRAGDRQAAEVFRRSNPWTPTGHGISIRLCELGITTDSNMDKNCAGDFGSETFAQTVEKVLEGRSIVTSPLRTEQLDEVELWNEVCRTPHPFKTPYKPSIIHQFSDLFFDADGRNASWDSYLTWLKHEIDRETEDQRQGRMLASQRPHFIVVCGNLVAGVGEDPGPALRELKRAVGRMQSLDEDSSPRAAQIVIVPGVFDLEWSAWRPDDKVKRYRLAWDDEVASIGFTPAGKAVSFHEVGLEFFAFDTVDTEGIGEVDAELQDDVAEVRKLVTADFRKSWANYVVASPDIDDPLHREKLEELWRYTLEYIAPLKPGEPRPDTINSENLVWRERIGARAVAESAPKAKKATGKAKTEPASATYRMLLTEQGYVSKKAREELLQSLWDPQRGRARVSIAVMHHYLKPRRRSAVTEFFHPFDFHKGLMRRGVQLVLHGHSAGPQCLVEQIHEARPRVAGRLREGDTLRSPRGGDPQRAMHFVGSGSFSGHGMWVVDSDEEGPRHEAATFNKITIRRKEYDVKSDDGGAHDLWTFEVQVYELTGEGLTIREGNALDFDIYGNV